jgi:hypothetical protein
MITNSSPSQRKSPHAAHLAPLVSEHTVVTAGYSYNEANSGHIWWVVSGG